MDTRGAYADGFVDGFADGAYVMAIIDTLVWYGMVWYGMVWYGMVWYGMVWYGMGLRDGFADGV